MTIVPDCGDIVVQSVVGTAVVGAVVGGIVVVSKTVFQCTINTCSYMRSYIYSINNEHRTDGIL